MKKFAFSLQKVLDLREFAEEQAKIALAEAISTADAIKAELALTAQKKVETNASRSAAQSIEDQIAIGHYIQRLDARTEELLEELASAELVIEEKRAAMADAMKERKVLSKLRDKKYEEYRQECLKEDDSNLDDITQPRYANFAG